MESDKRQEVGRCATCGHEIPRPDRQHRRYCSQACQRNRKRKRKRNPAYWARAKERARLRYQNDPTYRERLQNYSRKWRAEHHAIDIVERHLRRIARKRQREFEQELRRIERERTRKTPEQKRQDDCIRSRYYRQSHIEKVRTADRERYWRNREKHNAYKKVLNKLDSRVKEQRRKCNQRRRTSESSVINALRDLGWLEGLRFVSPSKLPLAVRARSRLPLMEYVNSIIARQLDELDARIADPKREARRIWMRNYHHQRRANDPIFRQKLNAAARAAYRRQKQLDPEGVRERARLYREKIKQDPIRLARQRQLQHDHYQANRERYAAAGKRAAADGRRKQQKQQYRGKRRAIIQALRELGWLNGYEMQIPPGEAGGNLGDHILA